MTEPQTPGDQSPEGQSRPDQLLEEASLWFARMRGPDAETYQLEFDAWLARGASHLGAYNRASEIFSMGKFLAEPEERFVEEQVQPRRRAPIVALLAGVAFVLLLAIWWTGVSPIQLGFGGSPEIAGTRRNLPPPPVLLTTAPSQRRTYRLQDGSKVTLEAGSRLSVSYSARERSLRLTQGRGRFDVAHEARAFVVYAGHGSVTAHGTVFDVTIDHRQQVKVRLIRGAIDVVLPANTRSVQHLTPGQEVSFTTTTISTPTAMPSPEPSARPPAVGEFEAVTLSDLVADANRQGGRRIVVADRSLGALRVSGRFSLSDPEKLADRLAMLLDLVADKGDPEQITLHRR